MLFLKLSDLPHMLRLVYHGLYEVHKFDRRYYGLLSLVFPIICCKFHELLSTRHCFIIKKKIVIHFHRARDNIGTLFNEFNQSTKMSDLSVTSACVVCHVCQQLIKSICGFTVRFNTPPRPLKFSVQILLLCHGNGADCCK